MSSRTVIPDTNTLIYSVKQHIDLEWEISKVIGSHRTIMLKCVRNELEKLSSKIREASMAIKIFSSLELMESYGSGDECLEKMCLENDFVLITNDRMLAKKVVEKGGKVLNLSDGRNLKWYR